MSAIYVFERAKGIYVVDGDTVDIEVDLGFSVKVKHRFRLTGINTPERGQQGFTEAKDFLQAAVNVGLTRIEVTKVDKYGRYLAELFASGFAPDISVNDRMVDLGLAVRYTA